jgi:outer membrane protein assembly factor BamA/autotransporter translocation and assembly factor TamB
VTASGGEKEAGEPSAAGPAASPRRSWIRRALRGLAALGLLALLLVAFAFAFVHTPPGSAAARALVEWWGSRAIGGPLRVGTLDLRLWKGAASATAVSLRLEGATVDVPRVEIDWSPKSGPHVHLLRPRVVVRDTGEPEAEKPPATGLAAQPWRVLEKLGRAEVVEGRLELRDEKGEPWLVLGRIDLEMAETGGRRQVSVRVADAGVGWPHAGLHVKPAAAEGALALDGGRLVCERARVTAGASSVEVSGRLERISPITASASGRAALDGALVEALAPGTGLAGRIEADAKIAVQDDRVTGTLAATAPALTLKGVGPWAASGGGRFEGPRLVLEALEAKGYGGRLVAEGPLALLSSQPTDVRARAEGIDVAALATTFARADVPVAARADGSLRWTATGWDVDAAKGTGEITLRPSPRAARPPAAPGLPLSGSGRVRIAGRALALEGASVEAHGARVAADAALAADGTVRGSWGATLPLAAVNALLADLGSKSRLAESYTGTLAAEGEISGSVSSPEPSATVRSEDLAARGRPHSVEAQARYAAGRLELEPLTVRSGLGQATLAGSVPVFADAGEWDLRGEVESLDLAPALALAGLEGACPATGTLRIEGPRDAPRARAALEGRVVLDGDGGAAGEPIAITLAASSEGESVAVERLTAETASGRVEGSGRFDAATRAIEAKASATGLDWARLPRLPEALRRLGGTLSAEVSLGGTTSAPAGQAHATLGEATLDGSPLPALTLDARADGRRIELAGRAGDAAFLKGAGDLDGDWPVRFEIDAGALPAQALLDAFPAAREYEATLAAQGTVSVEVPLGAPERLRYSAEGLRASGKVRRLEWTVEPFRVEGDRHALSVGGLRLATERTSLAVDGRVALAPSATFDLAVDGKADLEALGLVLPGDRLDGDAALQLRVAGTGEAPEVTGEATLDDGRGRHEGARWDGLKLRARFLGREAEVDELSARVLGGSVTARGRLPLLRLGSGEPARLSFEAKDVDLARMLDADLRLDAAASFLVSVEGQIESTAPSVAALRGRGRLVRLESKSPEGTMGLDAPAEWRLEDGRFALDPLRLTGPLGTLEARAEARFSGGAPGGSATIAGPLDLRFVSPFVPDTTLSGPARIDARASWGKDGVRLEGGVKVEGARVVLEGLAFAVSQVTGELRFLGDRVALEATGSAGDGKLQARGEMALGPALLGPAEVTLQAERLPIAYPEGFRGRASGTIRLKGDPDSAYVISGDVGLRQGHYTAEFDASSQSLGRLDWQLAALRGGTVAEKLPLDVNVRLEEPLRIRNSRAKLDVLGSLTASGTLAQPTATGQVTLREGGTLTLGRGNVRVAQGLVELNGYPGGTPEIDFQGATRVGGTGINVQARGTIEDLQLTLDSPDNAGLSQTDLVTLLLTGRTASAAASQSGVIVAEELAVALGGVLQKGVGDQLLIDVSPDQSLLNDDTDPTQRFNVGHRIGNNLVMMYSTALDGTEQRWILDFNPGGGRFRFRLIREEDNSASVEVTDRFSFDLWSRGRRAGRKEREVERLSALRFEGTLPVPEDELRKAAKLRTRGRHSALQREEAGERVRAELAKRGWPAATVDAESVPAGSRSVELVLRVTPGPRVSFRWSGDPLDGKARRKAEEAWPSYASPDVAAGVVARGALVPLQAQAHYAAEVVPEVGGSGDDIEVSLRVALGAKGQGVRVAFEGNAALDDRALAAVLPKPGSRAFFEALDGRSSGLTNALRLAYARAGYLDARALPPRSAVDPATGSLVVTFPVRERRASPVAGVELPAEIVAAGTSGPALALKAGAPFDVSAYVADRDAIGKWYRGEGWPEARVAGILEPGPGGVSVRFAATPGPRPRVGAVRFAQDGQTRERVIRGAMTLAPGDLIRPRDLAESRARLAELGLFRSIEVRPEPRAGDPGVRDIGVDLTTRPDVTVEYGVRYTTGGSGAAGDAPSTPDGGRLQFAGGLELANPLGWGWRVRGYSFLTTDRQTYGVNLDAATLFGRRLRSQLLVYDDRDQDIVVSSLASHVKGVTFQQTKSLRQDLTDRRWHDRLRLQYGYTFKDILYVENASQEQLIAENRAFLSLALIGDERDSLTDPRRGWFWTVTGELSRRFLGSDADYVRLYGQAFTYVSLGPVTWAQGYRLGAVPGKDPLLLIENRFRAGGPTTVRGFEQNGLGPQTAEGDSLGGQAVAVLNQELRFPIWKRVKGGVFWDAGEVWLLSRAFGLRDLRQSVGAGLRVMFPFGPVRVEYAWVLDPREGESKGRFVFGLGHAF